MRSIFLKPQGLGLCVLLVQFLSAAAAADNTATVFNPTPVAGWVVSIGGAVQVGPKFDGASIAGLAFMPSFSLRRTDEPPKFSAPDDGLDYAVIESDGFMFGPVANFRPGRYQRAQLRQRGLYNVPWAVEAGAFAEYWVIKNKLRARLEVMQGFYGHHGVTANAAVDWVEKSGRFTFSVGPRLALGSTRALNRYFGISGAEAITTGLPVYRASGGVKSVGAATALGYEWSPAVTTTVFARYDRLTGPVEKSPIVRRLGDRNQFNIGLSLIYSFVVRD